MPSDVDPQILWETTKCAIRGFCISFSSTLAKAKTHQITQLQNKIQSLQNLQKQHFTEQQATQLSSLKEGYDLLSHSKAEFILHRTCNALGEVRTHTHTIMASTFLSSDFLP